MRMVGHERRVGGGSMGAWINIVRESLRRREPFEFMQKSDAFRAVSGEVDGLPGVFVDVLGPGAVVNVYDGLTPRGFEPEPFAEDLLSALTPMGVRGVYVKRFVRDRSRLGGELPPVTFDPDPRGSGGAGAVVGEHDPDRDKGGGRVIVREEIPSTPISVRLEVRLWDGLSTGLFLDQRENRLFVGGNARGNRVLNTFAYTCAFSVSAAVGGATEVTSVDVSAKYLEWGKRNFTHNRLDPSRHRFARMDTFEFFQYARRKGFSYDLIILDPPSFGSGNRKKGTPAWNAIEGYARLVKEASGLLTRGGLILASTNNTELCAPGRLRREISRGLGLAGRRPVWRELPPVGLDVRAERGRFSAEVFAVA